MPGQLYGSASTDLASSIHPSGFSDVFPAHAPASSDPAFDSANSTADPSVEQILAYVDGVAIVQGTSRTPSLVGTSVVSISCYDLDGRSALLGVFHVGDPHFALAQDCVADTGIAQDLAVDVLGRFVLRYRAANMLWRGGPRERPIVAECWGAPFEVYAAHSFPGLQESTEMTKVSQFPETGLHGLNATDYSNCRDSGCLSPSGRASGRKGRTSRLGSVR